MKFAKSALVIGFLFLVVNVKCEQGDFDPYFVRNIK